MISFKQNLLNHIRDDSLTSPGTPFREILSKVFPILIIISVIFIINIILAILIVIKKKIMERGKEVR